MNADQFCSARNLVHPFSLLIRSKLRRPSARHRVNGRPFSPFYPSFALIVIFAFNTFDTGHPFSAASAYF